MVSNILRWHGHSSPCRRWCSFWAVWHRVDVRVATAGPISPNSVREWYCTPPDLRRGGDHRAAAPDFFPHVVSLQRKPFRLRGKPFQVRLQVSGVMPAPSSAGINAGQQPNNRRQPSPDLDELRRNMATALSLKGGGESARGGADEGNEELGFQARQFNAAPCVRASLCVPPRTSTPRNTSRLRVTPLRVCRCRIARSTTASSS